MAELIRRNADVVIRGLKEPDASQQLLRNALVGALSMSALVEDATRALVVFARDAGATWAEIGDLLHVSRQAAQQRFGGVTMSESDPSTVTAVRRAEEVVELLRAGEFNAVVVDFDGVMSSKLSADELRAVWNQVVANLGAVIEVGRTVITRKGGYTIADVPLGFERAQMKARITFNSDGSIGGLFVLDSE